jgi:uncharacterized membrane protein (DUF485 family)
MLSILNITKGALMPFQEKSAWLMSFTLLLGGIFYFGVVAAMSAGMGTLAPPLLPVVVVYTVILTIIAAISHIVIAIFAPKEANASLDERERRIFDRAAHLSGYVFGSGVILSLGVYLITYNGNLLFYSVFGSLMLSQLFEYVFQIALYRGRI